MRNVFRYGAFRFSAQAIWGNPVGRDLIVIEDTYRLAVFVVFHLVRITVAVGDVTKSPSRKESYKEVVTWPFLTEYRPTRNHMWVQSSAVFLPVNITVDISISGAFTVFNDGKITSESDVSEVTFDNPGTVFT